LSRKSCIYSVLSFIINNTEEDLSQYFLELEWYEDFSIKKNDSYVSIHQVKSYKKKDLSEYKDAIWSLLGKSIDDQIPFTYLHSSKDIVNIKEKLKNQVQPRGDQNQKYTPAYYYKMIMESGRYEEAFSSFYKYKYHKGDNFCKIDDIDFLIKELIRMYYDSQGKEESDKQIHGVFLYFLNILNEHITDRHAGEQHCGSKMEPMKINFSQFCKVLETNHKEPSQEYYIFHLRNSFYANCDMFLQYLFEYNHFEKKDLERVEDFLIGISMLNNEKFLEFCKRITPHVEVPKINMRNYRNLITKNGLKQALILILIKVKQQTDENFLFRKTNGQENKFYLPTTIDLFSDSLLPDDFITGELARGILKNENLDEFLYEIDVMISRYINIDSLEAVASGIGEVPEVDPINNPDRYTKFTKIKEIKIINLEQAEKEL